jgi:hypothetical protein
MTRERAIEVSDALAVFGQSHTIVVGVADGYAPRERYTVNVTPTLSYSETDLTALQRLADSLKCGIGYVAGSFTFTESRGGDS